MKTELTVVLQRLCVCVYSALLCAPILLYDHFYGNGDLSLLLILPTTLRDLSSIEQELARPTAAGASTVPPRRAGKDSQSSLSKC